MGWIKDAYLDVIILLFIILFAVYGNSVLEVVLWVYTSLLLISKLLAMFMPALQKKANKTSAPPLFYNIIYALTVAILIYGEFHYLSGAWLAIWLASIINFRSSKKSLK